MKHIKLFEQFLNIDLDNIVAKLKEYTAMDGEWATSNVLVNLFSKLDIQKAKKTYPDIFEFPKKYIVPGLYFFRGTGRSLEYLKTLGEPDEILGGGFVSSINNYYSRIKSPELLIWNDINFKFTGDIQSWSMYLNVALHFADSSSSWNQPPYNTNKDELLPVILMINYKKNKKNIFMNPDWITKISGINEGEVFHRGKVATIDLAIVIDKSIKDEFSEVIKKLRAE